MANLLPVQEKKQLNKEYRIRLLIVYVVAVGILIAIAIVLLVPTYVFSLERNTSATKHLDIARASAKSPNENRDPVDIAQEVHDHITLLDLDASKQVSPRTLFGRVVSYKPSTLTISSLLYNSDSQGIQVTIEGVSSDRIGLDTFVKALKSESSFQSVELPISNLVSGTDITFSILVTLDNDHDK